MSWVSRNFPISESAIFSASPLGNPYAPEEIIGKKGAWEGSVAGHAVRDQDTAIAMEIAREYLSGHYPDGWTPGMTFGSREAGGGWVARNEFITGPNTMYWRYGK